MSGGRIGVVRGTRPEGSGRNGLPEGAAGGYRYRDHPGWNPAEGVHRSEAEVRPRADPAAIARGLKGAEAAKAAYEERLAAFARLDADGTRPEEIRQLLGITQGTMTDYRRVLRQRAARLPEYLDARGEGFSPGDAAVLAGITAAGEAGAAEQEWQKRNAAGGEAS